MSAPTTIVIPTPFGGRDGRKYKIVPLTKGFVENHWATLSSVHDLIPHLGGKTDEMTRDVDESTGHCFIHKWSISSAAEYDGVPIGFLVAYIRDYSERHPFRSAYIHRMAVAKPHQRNSVGICLLANAISSFFEAMPWLLTITVQTNDESTNAGVLSFYRRAGFKHAYQVKYRDKNDSLMDLERTTSVSPGSIIPGFEPLRVPGRQPVEKRLTNPFESAAILEPRVVHFATTSRDKLVQYKFIGRSYGLLVKRLQHNLSLTEPQIEPQQDVQSARSAESALVAGPLKLFSRFAAKATAFPIMVEDTMLFIEHFNKDFAQHPMLPGPDTKRWWFALGVEGILQLMGRSKKRAAKYVCQIGINYAPGQYTYFRTELVGSIAKVVQAATSAAGAFPYANPTFFHRVFVPDGAERTLAEMDSNEFLRHDYRRLCFSQALQILMEAAPRTTQLDLFDQ